MALRFILIVAVLLFAFGSIQVAVLGDSPSDNPPTCFLSALEHAENSSLLDLLCRAIYAFTLSGLPLAPVPNAYCFSRAQSPALSVHSPLSRLSAFPPPFNNSHPIKMPKERLRMISRCGGSRGRATAQHSSTTLDPPEDALVYLATRSGRDRGRGHDRGDACMHHVHPTARYRIPCSLANSSFIVSVTIERCEHNLGPGAVQQRAMEEQRLVSQISTPRQGTGSMPATHSEANVGPSTRGEPSNSAVHSSDSMDSGQFGCRVIEEQPSTSDED